MLKENILAGCLFSALYGKSREKGLKRIGFERRIMGKNNPREKKGINSGYQKKEDIGEGQGKEQTQQTCHRKKRRIMQKGGKKK